jgi:hypothetical protein
MEVEPSRYTVSSDKPHHHSMESSEQPFAFTGSPSVTFTPDFTPTTRLVMDYVEPTEETVTSRAVRIQKVKIPSDYEDFESESLFVYMSILNYLWFRTKTHKWLRRT